MQLSSIPQKFNKAIAESGEVRTVPDNSQIGIVNGAASLETGFPPLNRTPVDSGGVPPSIRDMNEILRRLSNIDRWLCAGGGFTHDSTYATAISGYPKGAKLVRDDGYGYWLNTADNNTSDPDSNGISGGWIPVQEAGTAEIDVTGFTSNITLTPEQYGKKTIVVFGSLSANIDLIFPASTGEFSTEWTIINATDTSSFALRAVAGTGINTFLNGGMIKVSNHGGMTTLASTGFDAKASNGLTPVTLIRADSAPALIMVTNALGIDWWLVMLYDTGSTVGVKVIDSVVTTANGETFTATRNPYELKISVSSGTEAYYAKIVQDMR
jgi:hypothetical protein